MEKQLLLICATHGNERIGLEAVEELRSRRLDRYFDSVIGNPRALAGGVRYWEQDLNRSYPGDPEARAYEARRASELLKLAKKYRYVIDLHEASSGINNFIIAPRARLGQSFPVEKLDLDKILLWPDPQGPLGSVMDNEVELEFGMKRKERKLVVAEAVATLAHFIAQLDDQTDASGSEQKIFSVYGKLKQEDLAEEAGELKDFEWAEIKGEKFLPLLVGQYPEEGIVCYQMRPAAG